MERFTVLGSGSTGNSALLESASGGVLIDFGLPPQELTLRLDLIHRTWQAVRCVVLTHTHSDHWNRYTLEHLRRLSIPLFLHPEHQAYLSGVKAFEPMRRAGLIQTYLPGQAISLLPTVRGTAVEVPHDSPPTYGFRFDSRNPHQLGWSLGYASDVGVVQQQLLDHFAGVDVLALEFNHDVGLEKKSRRPRMLVDRVLGDRGHLSNRQAAEATCWLIESIQPCPLQAVVQLHLSRDCNHPDIAAEVLTSLLHEKGLSLKQLITARHDRPVDSVPLVPNLPNSVTPLGPMKPCPAPQQLLLPGFE